ncbi:sugar phosphate isomerase/epimerase family protein [Vagococcus zengguangii]|uniref:Sugar phosphate isomerase/epimerase n=1 Tax=Vagococcus zengguangii TaxID=2571750 RepID=A0A4D7CN92_9ENTE|nr:sugar phosphate isomerase/epimerase [Vagococcus zengguangii]QCI85569.1 sugar phosphate isomerase/epimerase [Vagococcus zengguangii]TLG79424.1 sugar phosphate isomerase/epimerase [Vagococcus zengguangii]
MTKTALQLWSVKEACVENFAKTLCEVADMGYEGIEFAGYYDMPAEALRELLEELKLEVAGSHIPIERLRESFDDVVAYEKTIGNQRIVVPWLQHETTDEWLAAFEELTMFQEKLAARDMTLIYHNHAHELLDFEAFNVLAEMANHVPTIKFEVDTYWIAYGGLDVLDWLNTYKERVELLHIKELMGTGDARESTEIGNGVLPISDYVAFAQEYAIEWLIIEQEAFQNHTPLESARLNVERLKELMS